MWRRIKNDAYFYYLTFFNYITVKLVFQRFSLFLTETNFCTMVLLIQYNDYHKDKILLEIFKELETVSPLR